MKSGKVRTALKVVVACFIVVMACAFYVGDTAQAGEFKKKNESCYLSYVKAEVAGEDVIFRGSLKPVGVPAEQTWEEFFSDIKVTTFKLVNSGYCGEDEHTMVMAYIYIDGEWRDLFYYDKEDNMTYYQLEDIELTESYYDVKFGFSNDSASYTSTGIYARFSREYKIFYELNGGKFEGDSLDAYTTGADYKLPIPIKSGYEFTGWTGTGLTKVTKDVVIKNGDTGNKSYTANWVAVKTDNGTSGDNNSQTKVDIPKTDNQSKVEAPAQTKVKSATKKKDAKKAKVSIKKVNGAVGYKVQFSTTKKFKKIIVTKTIKKVTATIQHKKLKNKQTLFVRVKAYKLDGKTKVWAAKWSKAKKVKIK